MMAARATFSISQASQVVGDVALVGATWYVYQPAIDRADRRAFKTLRVQPTASC
jgi:hypothetical protein